MKIDKVYIATHKQDLRFTRICVASVRYFYPEIPILLIKDEHGGAFSTDEIESAWNVGVFQCQRKYFGWGLSKLEPLFSEEAGHRFLILDSDIVLVGPLLQVLEACPEDFVVHHEEPPPALLRGIYLDLDELSRWDTGFRYPDYAFNTGQWVASGGLVRREEFEALVDWGARPPALKHPSIFKNGDQGILNYVLMKKQAAGQASVGRVPIMKWQGEIEHIDTAAISTRRSSPYPFLIHWAGLKKPLMKDMVRSDILFYFEGFYYSRVRHGRLKKAARPSIDKASDLGGRIARRLQRMMGKK